MAFYNPPFASSTTTRTASVRELETIPLPDGRGSIRARFTLRFRPRLRLVVVRHIPFVAASFCDSRLRLAPLNLPANYDAGLPEFEEGVCLKLADGVGDKRRHQRLQLPVADVPGRNQKQLRRASPEEV
jgi:hypothetical protein